MTQAPTCTIVGSCFIDYIGYCDRLPLGGETLHSTSFQKGFGGKGANQAYMVALCNSSLPEVERITVRMATAVGKDGDGTEYVERFRGVGIDTTCMKQVDGQSTGLAMISVSTTTGQNQIVICPNATYKFIPAAIQWNELFSAEGGRKALVVQNEIPLETTLKALEVAKSKGYITVFNPAPAPVTEADIDTIRPYLKYVDVFCPNETEAALIAGMDVTKEGGVTIANAENVARKLMDTFGIKNVVITMGSQGCCVLSSVGRGAASDGLFCFIPAVKAEKVVDTTGAGDCFVGAMVAGLLVADIAVDDATRGADEVFATLAAACSKACEAASLSVQAAGTQSSFPRIALTKPH